MIKQSVEKISEMCHGRIVHRGLKDSIEGISTDSRTIKSNDLFIPLIGENFDGHDFIQAACERGASAILKNRDVKVSFDTLDHIYIIEVDDTTKALQDMSKAYKELFSIPFIGITGSNGKTSTKDMISSVLSSKFHVLKNIGNFNNHIGLPLTLFNLDKHHEIAVLEMGMSEFGEIQTLAEIVKPQVAVITNIGVSHIANLGSRENIMKAKMEISSYLEEGDYLLLNGDNDLLSTLKDQSTSFHKIFFGLKEDNDIYPQNLVSLHEEGYAFDIEVQGKRQHFIVKQPGIHNVYNALAAIWVGMHYHMNIDEIRNGLENFIPSKMRMEVHTVNDIKVINDAYNASPDSMKAALSVLSDMKDRRKIAVLGNMFELGEFSEEGHREVGAYAADKADILITVGEMANWIGEEFAALVTEKEMYQTQSNHEAIEILEKIINKGDVVLIKGSRGMKMEEIAHYLQERS